MLAGGRTLDSPNPPATTAALLEALQLLLPRQDSRRLLAAMLLEGDQQAEALRNVAADPDHGLRAGTRSAGAKGLRPLLHHAVATRGWPCDPAVLTVLRTARAREQARMATVARVAQPALQALEDAGVEFALLNGIALAWTVYPEAALRHCHDIDLLMRPEALPAAIAAVERAGFVECAPDESRPVAAVRRVHASGLPLELHVTLFPERYYSLPGTEVMARARAHTIWGRTVRTLTPDDQLLHVLGLAACTPQREGLRWVCDAHALIRSGQAMDWDQFVSYAVRARLTVPISILVTFLADAMRLPVPLATLDVLREHATAASPLARDIALAGARAGQDDNFALVRGIRSGWVARALTLRWLVWPSQAYLLHTAQTGHGTRALRYGVRLVRRLLQGPSRILSGQGVAP